jgi:hypothetical protein
MFCVLSCNICTLNAFVPLCSKDTEKSPVKKVEKSPLKQKNVSPSKLLDDSPIKAPARKRARILESDDEEENVQVSDKEKSSEKTVEQRLEKIVEEKQKTKVFIKKKEENLFYIFPYILAMDFWCIKQVFRRIILLLP